MLANYQAVNLHISIKAKVDEVMFPVIPFRSTMGGNQLAEAEFNKQVARI